MVLESFFGDWIDATEKYRAFFVEESHALYRESGQPVRLRDQPPHILPEPYRALIAMVGISGSISALTSTIVVAGMMWPNASL